MDYEDERERSKFWDRVLLGSSVIAVMVTVVMVIALVNLR